MRTIDVAVLAAAAAVSCSAPGAREEGVSHRTGLRAADAPRVTGSDATATVGNDDDVDAAPAPPARLTLDDALAFAREHHPRLLSARAEIEAAAARVFGAGRLPNPSAILRMEEAPIDKGSSTGDAEYLLGVNQSLPLGDRRAAERTVASHEEMRARRELEAAVRDVERSVRGAFATALYAERVADVRAELLEASRSRRELVTARVDAGDVVSAELAPVELEELDDALELERANAARAQALVAVAAAVGAPRPPTSVEGDLAVAFELPSLAELLDRLDRDPALLAADADGALARARLDLADELRIPDVRLAFLYRRSNSSRTDAFDVGLAVPLRVFDDGRARVREEQARVSRSDARRRLVRVTLEGELRAAHGRARLAMERAALLRDEILPRIDDVRTLTEARWEAGDVALDERLAAQRSWYLARLAHLESLHDALSAWAELAAFLGDAGTARSP